MSSRDSYSSDQSESHDDESTLEEEEALGDQGDVADELSLLHQEQDMPLERLRELYGRSSPSVTLDTSAVLPHDDFSGSDEDRSTSKWTTPDVGHSCLGENDVFPSGFAPLVTSGTASSTSGEDIILSNRNLTLNKEDIPSYLVGDEDTCPASIDELVSVVSEASMTDSGSMDRSGMRYLVEGMLEEGEEEEDGEDADYVPGWSLGKRIRVGPDHQAQLPDVRDGEYSCGEHTNVLFLCLVEGMLEGEEEEEDGSDADYVPGWSLGKRIRVGPDHQAQLPDVRDGEYSCGQSSPGRLVWRPAETTSAAASDLSDVNEFLRKVHEVRLDASFGDVCDIRNRSICPPDDEKALKMFLDCNYDTGEAVKRLRDDASHATRKHDRHWPEKDVVAFEEGLRKHGKNFHRIRDESLPEKSIGQVVHFYYFWKKTLRRRRFAEQLRHERQQRLLMAVAHPYLSSEFSSNHRLGNRQFLHEHHHGFGHENANHWHHEIPGMPPAPFAPGPLDLQGFLPPLTKVEVDLMNQGTVLSAHHDLLGPPGGGATPGLQAVGGGTSPGHEEGAPLVSAEAFGLVASTEGHPIVGGEGLMDGEGRNNKEEREVAVPDFLIVPPQAVLQEQHQGSVDVDVNVNDSVPPSFSSGEQCVNRGFAPNVPGAFPATVNHPV